MMQVLPVPVVLMGSCHKLLYVLYVLCMPAPSLPCGATVTLAYNALCGPETLHRRIYIPSVDSLPALLKVGIDLAPNM